MTRTKTIGKLRMGIEALALLLLICSMVLLVGVIQRLPDRLPVVDGHTGRAEEWGTPLHFITVFGAGMFLYGGLSVVMRYRNLFGVPLFKDERRAKARYEATMLLLSLLKVYSLGIFLAVLYNMYATVRRPDSPPALDWLIFALLGAVFITAAVYAAAVLRINRKAKREE